MQTKKDLVVFFLLLFCQCQRRLERSAAAHDKCRRTDDAQRTEYEQGSGPCACDLKKSRTCELRDEVQHSCRCKVECESG